MIKQITSENHLVRAFNLEIVLLDGDIINLKYIVQILIMVLKNSLLKVKNTYFNNLLQRS